MTLHHIRAFALFSSSLFCGLGCPAATAIQDPAEADTDQKGRNDLIPPRSLYPVPDDDPPKNRPVIQIVQDGRVIHGTKTWFDPEESADYAPMFRLLLELKSRSGVAKQKEVIGRKTVTLVNDPILIRADKHTEWHWVGAFMEQCSRPETAFWKIELGMSEAGANGEDLPAKLPAYLPKDAIVDTRAEPEEQLVIRIVCSNWGTEVPRKRVGGGAARDRAFELEDHRIHWQVGPRKVVGEDELKKHLKRIFDDRDGWPADRETGRKAPFPVVIEPGKETTYADVATTVDAVTATGFPEIYFGGGKGARKR